MSPPTWKEGPPTLGLLGAMSWMNRAAICTSPWIWALAEPEGRSVDESAQVHLRYATKFPEITRRHLQDRGIVAEIIKLYGSIEIAPLVGLADRIVDLVSSGETLRQHHLREVETILDVSARICVGRAAAKLHGDRLDTLIANLRAAVASPGG